MPVYDSRHSGMIPQLTIPRAFAFDQPRLSVAWVFLYTILLSNSISGRMGLNQLPSLAGTHRTP